MEGSQPFIYRCAPRGTRTGTLVHFLGSMNLSPMIPKTVDVRSGWTRVDDLAKDVYVVKGRKVIVR